METPNDSRAQLDFFWKKIYAALAIIIRASGKDLEEFVDQLRDAHANSTAKVKPGIETTALHRILPTLTSIWRSDPNYTDKNGEPLHLDRYGSEPSIETAINQAKVVAELVRAEIDVNEAVELLLKSECVKESDGALELVRPDFVFSSEGALHRVTLLRSLAGFLGTIANNVQSNKKGLLQSYAWSVRFPKKDLGILESDVKEQGMQFLVEVDNTIMNVDEVPDNEKTFAGAGIYLYHEDT